MSPRPAEEDWDLTPVIDLIYSLSTGEESAINLKSSGCSSEAYLKGPHVNAGIENGAQPPSRLGNFDKIWQYLNQPLDLIPPEIPEIPEIPKGELIDFLGGDDHNDPSPFKAVRWRDELEGADLADNDENDDPQTPSRLTKQQRKKARRKQRRKDQTEASTAGKVLPSGSEDDSGKDVQTPRTPDRKAVIHNILHGDSTPDTAPGRLRSGKLYKAEPPTNGEAWPVASPQTAKKVVEILRPRKDSVFAAAVAKKAKLIAMLTETFIDERQFLSNISFIQHIGNAEETPLEGIHVFVDISNVRPWSSNLTHPLRRSLTTFTDHDRFPRRPQILPRPIPPLTHAPPAPLLPQLLPHPRTRPPHRQTHSRRLRQLPRHRRSQSDWLRN